MAGVSSPTVVRAQRSKAEFRVGKVKGYLRNKVWYLCYFENGKRLRPRVGQDRKAAEQLAAQVNGQLAAQAPSLFSFDDIALVELRQRWLDHHEHVLRSSLATINRYRTASDHLMRFVASELGGSKASQFTTHQAGRFVKHLRSLEVAPNGHAHTAKRPLRDKGVVFILETCRAMFTYAQKRRHLAPYADNPFKALDLERIPIEDAKPISLFTAEEEQRFFEACNDWELPIFATLALTGMRPGELVHLLVEEDVDLDEGTIHVRNKAELGWQVKTRNERSIPLLPELRDFLRGYLKGRQKGLLFRRERFPGEQAPGSLREMARFRVKVAEAEVGRTLQRAERQKIMKRLWWEAGVVRPERIRIAFIRLAMKIGRPDCTAPKLFRHAFATALQDANVDPLIRCELMGHAAGELGGLGMTGVYTHTRAETKRQETIRALSKRPCAIFVRSRDP